MRPILKGKQTAGKTDRIKSAKRRKLRLELVKTITIAVLFISMVTLASAEIVQTQRFSISPAVDIDIESLLVLYGDRSAESIAAYIMPEFLGYSISGISRGIFGGEATMRQLYRLLAAPLTELLCRGDCKTLPFDTGQTEWRSAREGDFIYLCYFEDLPASALAYAVSDGETELASGYVPHIRELFITLENAGGRYSYSIIARSKNGETCVYSFGKDAGEPVFDVSSLTAYNENRQLAEFTFLGEISSETSDTEDKTGENREEIGANAQSNVCAANVSGAAALTAEQGLAPEPAENDDRLLSAQPLTAVEGLASIYRLRDTTVLMDGEFTQKYITAEFGEELTSRIADKAFSEKLLGLLGINADRVEPYHSKGYKIYLGESGRLRFSDTGGIDYTALSQNSAGSGGVPVSMFLGYENYGGSYTFTELLNAAASLLESLEDISPDLLGGAASPGLISVTVNSENGLELVFGYFYDNYRIIGIGPAATLSFYDGALTRLAVTPASFAKGGLCVSLPQSWVIKQLYKDASEQEIFAGGANLTIVYKIENIINYEISPNTETKEHEAAISGNEITPLPEAAVNAEVLGDTDLQGEGKGAPRGDAPGGQDTAEDADVPVVPDWVILTDEQ